MCGIILFTQRAAAREDMFKITLIDVGKGDCILIQTGEEEKPVNVLIDTGYNYTADDTLKYFKDHKIETLDAMIISHFHKDHVGGAAKILREITVRQVYMPDHEDTDKDYKETMAVLTESGSAIPYERLNGNKTIKLGEAEYRLYSSTIKFDGSNDNDASMAISLDYNGHTALFAGDLEETGIEQLLKNKDIPEHCCGILKLPHHGSDEGNQTSELLKRLKKGGIALITDGQDRRAHGTLIDTLAKDGFAAYCSADDGTITITAAENGYNVGHTKDPEDCKHDGDWKYLISADGPAVITGYTGNETKITLPSEIGGYPVRSIADSAFYNHTNMESVTIPDSITAIGSSAFSWCTSLRNVTIPDSVTTIGNAAFSWCKNLTDIMIPDSVQSIGESGFERCGKLKNVKLSNALTGIAPSLFEHCKNLESIEIPAGVQTIGEDAFKRCEKLTEINIPDRVTLIDEGAFKRCESLGNIDIPEGVKSIGDSAFERDISLKTVKVPDSVTFLGKEAFKDCAKLESAGIGKGMKTIRENAFRDCTSLKDIYYSGTAGEWEEAVTREEGWNANTPADLEVHFAPAPDAGTRP